MRRLTRMRSVGAIGVTGVVFLLLVSAATGSIPAQSFTVAIAPTGLTAGNPAAAVGTFTNSGPAVAHVAVTFTFPFPVTVSTSHCGSVRFFPKTVICAVGPVAQGATATVAIPFTAPAAAGSLTLQGLAAFVTTGSPPPKAGLLKASTTATVFASNDPAHKGTCTTVGSASTTATADDQQVSLTGTIPSPSDPVLQSLGCTPVGVSVAATTMFATDVFSVDLPALSAPASVSLNFPDELLPIVPTNVPGNAPGVQGDGDQPAALLELNAAGTAGTPVPECTPPGFTTIPSGSDSCIASVVINDPDNDGDAGTINLLVQGSGVDPRYAG
jgi:hypothetical protein